MGEEKKIKGKSTRQPGYNVPQKNKKKKKITKKTRIIFFRFLLLIIMGIGIYFLATSKFFEIKEISVLDNEYYTDRQISNLSGAVKGVNLFKADLSAMKDKLLKDPYIKDVKISRKLPDKIIIRIVERQEYAAISYSEKYVIIDAERVVLQIATDGTGLPLIMEMVVLSATPGETIKIKNDSDLDKVISMISAGNENEINFIRVEFTPITSKAYINDNLYCEGTAESITDNMDALKEILADLYGKGIERGVIRINTGGHYSFSPGMK